ncbi:unnamed protein product [Diabrotica balteata]|uniref:Transposase n=1 Tax=Diabrotica balteata TaxID=107213 RepID=A0A9N9XD14_DIABA|nr:unnamed protein product [Diabrotica balteata]
MEDEIVVRIAEDPETITKLVSVATDISKSTVSRIIRTENLYPYRFTPVHNLLPQDFPARLRFSQFMIVRHLDNPMFWNKILFTDEATYTERSIYNSIYNSRHTYATENPHAFQEHHF